MTKVGFTALMFWVVTASIAVAGEGFVEKTVTSADLVANVQIRTNAETKKPELVFSVKTSGNEDVFSKIISNSPASKVRADIWFAEKRKVILLLIFFGGQINTAQSLYAFKVDHIKKTVIPFSGVSRGRPRPGALDFRTAIEILEYQQDPRIKILKKVAISSEIKEMKF